jgi:hypothetical protein
MNSAPTPSTIITEAAHLKVHEHRISINQEEINLEEKHLLTTISNSLLGTL